MQEWAQSDDLDFIEDFIDALETVFPALERIHVLVRTPGLLPCVCVMSENQT